MTLILIVENDPECIAEMKSGLHQAAPEIESVFLDNVPDAIHWLSRNLKITRLISLDQDLGPEQFRNGDVFDPGTGIDVVNYLAERNVCCPVILHTDSFFVRPQLQQKLADAGWISSCIMPGNGLSWIVRDWVPMVRHLVNEAANVDRT